jgi:hypothetical protein
MFEHFVSFLVSPPSRLKAIGAVLSQLGFVLTITGLFLQIGLKAVEMIQQLSRISPATAGVESIFPGLPTWFIPESPVGFVLWVAVCVVGWYCQYSANEIERVYFR